MWQWTTRRHRSKFFSFGRPRVFQTHPFVPSSWPFVRNILNLMEVFVVAEPLVLDGTRREKFVSARAYRPRRLRDVLNR